jgi:hypothetical protein
MHSKGWFSFLLVLALLSSALLSAAPAVAQPPGSAPLVAAAVSPLGTYRPVWNEAGLTELAPAVAYNSVRSEYLVVWYNDRAGNDDVRGQRLAADGHSLGSPFYIAAGAGADRRQPDVAYCSQQDQYLVVWQHQEPATGYSIHARRVSGTGLVLDPSDIVARAPGYNMYTPADPAVAYSSTSDRYLVVWDETWHPLPITRDVMGQVVAPNGALVGSAITVADDTTGNYRDLPALAYNRGRDEFLVAWQEWSPGANLWDIYARRVTGVGLLLDPTEIEICRLTLNSTRPSVAAIANVAGDGQYLVAYEIEITSTNFDAGARHVSSGGSALPGFRAASSGASESQPVVAGSESTHSFLSTWTRAADPPFAWTYAQAREVAPAGGGMLGIQLAGGVFGNNPDAVAGAPGDFLVVFEDSVLGGDSGIYGRLFGQRVYVPLALRDSH